MSVHNKYQPIRSRCLVGYKATYIWLCLVLLYRRWYSQFILKRKNVVRRNVTLNLTEQNSFMQTIINIGNIVLIFTSMSFTDINLIEYNIPLIIPHRRMYVEHICIAWRDCMRNYKCPWKNWNVWFIATIPYVPL